MTAGPRLAQETARELGMKVATAEGDYTVLVDGGPSFRCPDRASAVWLYKQLNRQGKTCRILDYAGTVHHVGYEVIEKVIPASQGRFVLPDDFEHKRFLNSLRDFLALAKRKV